jgi:hypothetical protein
VDALSNAAAVLGQSSSAAFLYVLFDVEENRINVKCTARYTRKTALPGFL